MLVVTPKPLPHESLMGYVLHLTEVNAYPSTSYILSELNGRWYNTAVGRPDATPLAGLAGLSPAEIDRLTMLPDGLSRAFVRVFGNDLPSAEVKTSQPKVCPRCLEEGRRCEAFWDLAQAAACPRHQVELIAMCPSCHKPLRWSRKKVRECRCGADLTAWPTTDVSPHLSGLMGLMQSLTYRGDACASVSADWRHLEHLTLRQLCKLLWVLSYVVQKAGANRRRSKARKNYRAELDKVAKSLSDWPHNFRTFLDDHYADVVVGPKPLPPFTKLFLWLNNGLIKNVEGGAVAFRFLAEEVCRFAAGHWTKSSVRRELSLALTPATTFRWGTHAEACEVLSLHPMTLKKMIKAGELITKQVAGRDRRGTVIDLEHAQSIKQSQHPAISVRDAAKKIGVSIETLKAMHISGLYERKHRPSFPGSLTVEDVADLSRRLTILGKGKGRLSHEGCISLEQAFRAFSATADEKAAVFGWLLEDPSRVIGCSSRSGLLGKLQVKSSAVEQFLRGNRDQDICVTVGSAAKQLGCSGATITGLKRAGHLDCKKHRGRVFPRKASLAHFDSRYELMGHISRRTGVPVKRIYARVDLSKIRHIRVLTVQYVTTFVLRSDVPAAEALIRAIR